MENINGSTKVLGLIGNPVEHTLSPLIHNTLAKMYGINMVYVPFHVKENLSAAVKGALHLNIQGLNVTVPYKSDVIECIDKIDPLAERIGAVNTLVKCEEGFTGYNTDMLGLYRSLQREGIEIEGQDIIIVGAGGVARAVAVMCASYGANKLYIMNRTIEKAQMIADEINGLNTGCETVVMRLTDTDMIPDKKHLAIQCTSIGLHPDCDKVPVTDKQFYKKIHTGYDLIYKPTETMFMKYVKEAGGNTYNGLRMLLYQGIIAFELWNQVSVKDEDADAVLKLMEAQ